MCVSSVYVQNEKYVVGGMLIQQPLLTVCSRANSDVNTMSSYHWKYIQENVNVGIICCIYVITNNTQNLYMYIHQYIYN